MDASCECQSFSGSQYITRCVEPTWQALKWNHTKKSSYFQALFNRHLSRCRCRSDKTVMMLDSSIITNCKINDWISNVLTDIITGRWKLCRTPSTSVWLLDSCCFAALPHTVHYLPMDAPCLCLWVLYVKVLSLLFLPCNTSGLVQHCERNNGSGSFRGRQQPSELVWHHRAQGQRVPSLMCLYRIETNNEGELQPSREVVDFLVQILCKKTTSQNTVIRPNPQMTSQLFPMSYADCFKGCYWQLYSCCFYENVRKCWKWIIF